MTDQEKTTTQNDDNAATMAGLSQVDEIKGSNHASFSLGKLEQDLRMLHVKWQAVETEISERDAEIASLRRQVEDYQGRCGELESDLEEMAAKKHAISNDLSKKSQSVSESADQLKRIEARNIELNVHKQELQDYIDGRKADWESLNKQIDDYANTIKGISDELAAHEKIVEGKEEEKAALALKVMELERELAVVKGRHSEQVASNVEIQQTLDDQSRELGSLSGDAIRLHKDIDKMRKKIERRDEKIEALQRELKERNQDSSTLENLLSEEKSTIAELQLKLNVANERIDELASDRQAQAAELQTALRTGEAAQQQAQDNAGELEIRSAELQAELSELLANHQSAEEELEAQRELVHVLERELSKKQENLEDLDRSADRLAALGTGIRELDMHIDDLWLKQPSEDSEPENEVFEKSEEVMIPPEDLFDVGEAECEHLIVANDEKSGEEISYPLNGKDMTIGRSPHCDIHLRSKYISRVHANVRVEGPSAIIEDAGSMNGFLVNSVQMRRHTLMDGDELEIGERKLRYVHN